MAKGQKRSGREPKKPKTAMKKAAPSPSVFDEYRHSPRKKGGTSTPKAE